jgi:hypothetical protein
MATYAQIRAGLTTRLDTIPGLHTSDEWPDQVVPPAALVKLVGGDYERAFGTGGDDDTDVRLEIWVALTLKGGLENSQRVIEEYLDNVGTNSIRAAIVADRYLGSTVGYTFVRGWREEDSIEINGQEFMGAVVDVEIRNQ